MSSIDSMRSMVRLDELRLSLSWRLTGARMGRASSKSYESSMESEDSNRLGSLRRLLLLLLVGGEEEVAVAVLDDVLLGLLAVLLPVFELLLWLWLWFLREEEDEEDAGKHSPTSSKSASAIPRLFFP